MKVTAITKFKQGDIYALLQKLGWTQSELARKSSIDPSRIGAIINMKQRPNSDQAKQLFEAFAEAGEFLDILSLWPEQFKGFPVAPEVVQTQEVDVAQLADYHQWLQIQNQGEEPEFSEEDFENAETAMECLTDREKRVVEMRSRGHTYKEIGEEIDRGGQSAQQIYRHALRKLRYRISINVNRKRIGAPLLLGVRENG